MCGLIHIKRFDNKKAYRMVLKRYRNQARRGKEGYGFVSVVDGKFTRFMKAENEKDIIKCMTDKSEDEIMFHHRNPTSTPNYWQTAHPIMVSHKSLKHDYYVIHNGCIHDTDKLKVDHDKQGFAYSTLLKQYWLAADKTVYGADEKYNDSETFAIELAKDLDGKKEGIDHVGGTIAFIALQVDKTTNMAVNLFWGRNWGSPLLFSKNDECMSILSEGKGVEVKEHTLNWYDYTSGAVGIQAEYKVGYTSYAPRTEYKGGNYGGATATSAATTETKIVTAKEVIADTKKYIGFGKSYRETLNEDEPILNADDCMELMDEYMKNKQELIEIEKTFTSGKFMSMGEMGDYYIERADDLRELIRAYEGKYVKPLPNLIG